MGIQVDLGSKQVQCSNKETSRTIEECNSLERHVLCVCHVHYISRPEGIVVLG